MMMAFFSCRARWFRCWCLAAAVGLPLGSLDASVSVVAHRGNSSQAPENTIASIQFAMGIAEFSEMDVRVTHDDRLVLMHDGSLNRTTDGRGAIRRKTLAEVEALDAGSWFSDDFIGEPVPTLEDALNASFTHGITPLIERKAGTAEMFHNEFTRLNLDEADFRVISFNRRFIADLHDLNPDYQLGVLAGGPITHGKLNRLAADGADFISWRHTRVRSQATVDLVHAHGMELHVWTVNQTNRMQELIDLGIDGITTDFPQLLRGLLDSTQLGAGTPDFSAITVTDPATAFAVPEPAASQIMLLALVLAGLGVRRCPG